MVGGLLQGGSAQRSRQDAVSDVVITIFAKRNGLAWHRRPGQWGPSVPLVGEFVAMERSCLPWQRELPDPVIL